MDINLEQRLSMRPFVRFGCATAAAAMLLAGSIAAASADTSSTARVVFVQSNDPNANTVLVYDRADNGTLTRLASVPTGGKGGRLRGAMSDPLGSQGSLQFDGDNSLLIGVNAGSNTIYSFTVDGGALRDQQTLSSGGVFPVSVAVHDNLVYALNAREGGSVQGYRIVNGSLTPIAGSNRSLGLKPNPTSTEFLTTPGDIAVTPDGHHLVVTTKANGNRIDVFQIKPDGSLSTAPVANASQTPVPFAISFDAENQLVVGEAGSSNVSTYTVNANGTLSPVGTATDRQTALCWIARDGDIYFVSNTGSGTESAFRIGATGHPTLLANTPVGPGPTDNALPAGGRFLYVLLGGNGSVAELHVNDNGTLTLLGTVDGHVGEEGIVAL